MGAHASQKSRARNREISQDMNMHGSFNLKGELTTRAHAIILFDVFSSFVIREMGLFHQRREKERERTLTNELATKLGYSFLSLSLLIERERERERERKREKIERRGTYYLVGKEIFLSLAFSLRVTN